MSEQITVTFRQVLTNTRTFTLEELSDYLPEVAEMPRGEVLEWLREKAVNENTDGYDELSCYLDEKAEVAETDLEYAFAEDEDGAPSIRQTACGRCGLDIEGPLDAEGVHFDRGGNTRCPDDDQPHTPIQD